MGRPRKALELHELQGTQPHYVPGNVPSSIHAGSLPKPAKFLSSEAKKKFRGLVKQLAARRTVTQGDADLLSIYASTFERWTQALEKVRTEGPVVAYSRLNNQGKEVLSEKPNLHLAIAETCERNMVSILTRLGLTPKDRESVRPTSTPPAPPKAPEVGTDEWARSELAAGRNPFAQPETVDTTPEPALADETLEKAMVEL
jgi:P27 family predicted phage terminase small subunit